MRGKTRSQYLPDIIPKANFAASVQRLLPRGAGLFAAIMAGKAPLMEMKEAAF